MSKIRKESAPNLKPVLKLSKLCFTNIFPTAVLMYNFFKLIDVSLYIILNEYRIYRYYFPKEILVLYNCTTVLAIYNSLP